LDKLGNDVHDRDKIDNWLDERFEEQFADGGVSRNSEQLNGRQIRNILSSAVHLARADNKGLELDHIKTMLNATRNFQDYLHEQTILSKQRNE
jgi:hypothetical protein